MAQWIPLSLLALPTLGIGCSGDSGAKCGFEVCGGDPLGQWYQESICPEEGYGHLTRSIVSDPDCRQRVNLAEVDFSVTLNLDALSAFAHVATTMLAWDMMWDAHCLGVVLNTPVPAEAMPVACEDYSKKITADASLPFTSGSCGMSVDGTQCICRGQLYSTVSNRGTFQSQNGYLSFNDGSRMGYCVKGSKMTIRDPNGSLGPVVENLQLRPIY